MATREYELDDGRKIKYSLSERRNRANDKKYYTVQVKVYEKRRRLLTLGLTKTWVRVNREWNGFIENPENIRDEFRQLRDIALGEEEDPLEKLLDDALVEIEPNHRG